MNFKKIKKVSLILLLLYVFVFILNNIRNFYNLSLGHNSNIVFLSIPIVISVIACYLFINRVSKSNKYLNVSFITLMIFYNMCNGLLYSTNIQSFFILYVTLLLFSFCLYIKNRLFSYSLIVSFSLMLVTTILFGMLGMLSLIKYLIPIMGIVAILYLKKNKKNNNYKELSNSFFNVEFLSFTILFIIAIIGGIGRFVHVYDEYSHWAYDAKAVIYYDKLSNSQEIMSKSRSYAPVITSWHYIVAQYSKFSEPNLYIGLSIFISIFLMSIFLSKNNKIKSLISIFLAYASCFIFGGVYSFNSLYADLAFGVVFGATLISIFSDIKQKEILLSIELIILTLIKPSGCTATFIILFILLLKHLFDNKSNGIINGIKTFISKNWKIVLSGILAFLIWNLYVRLLNNLNTEFFTLDLRPDGLRTDLRFKLNSAFISNFLKLIFDTFDQNLISGSINLSLIQFIMFVHILLFCSMNKELSKKGSSYGYALIIFISYFIFFGLTTLSIFYALSYYEATQIASFERYLNSINVAIILLIIYYFNIMINKSKKIELLPIIIIIFILSFSSFKNINYFILDYKDRENTLSFKDRMEDKFNYVNEKTSNDSKVFVIDQEDTDGIMAMWYSRYYAFPRKVNASSSAIAWKVKTEKNKDDLRDWGFTKESLIKELKDDKFEYVFFYSIDDDLKVLLGDSFTKYDEKIDLYKIIIKDNKLKLDPVY